MLLCKFPHMFAMRETIFISLKMVLDRRLHLSRWRLPKGSRWFRPKFVIR